MIKLIVFIFFLIMCGAEAVCARDLTLSVPERNWYPFTYVEASQVKGMHVDMVRKAVQDLGYVLTIKVLPSKRSLKYAKTGRVDGIISIAYSKENAAVLDFPADAATGSESKWRIMQVDHIIVTHNEAAYEFDGDIKTIPEPIRLPQGESFTPVLVDAGHLVYETRTDIQNFKMLARDKTGAVITTSLIAENMFSKLAFDDRLTIQAVPMLSESYHVGFSKMTALSSDEKQKIWDAVARLRDDYVYMLQLFAQY